MYVTGSADCAKVLVDFALLRIVNHVLTVGWLGASANFDNLVKFGDRREIRRSQMFIELPLEFMSHPITWLLGGKHRFSPLSIHFSQIKQA